MAKKDVVNNAALTNLLNPYYTHPNENPGVAIIVQVLSGGNYQLISSSGISFGSTSVWNNLFASNFFISPTKFLYAKQFQVYNL